MAGPFNNGELAVQQLANETHIAERVGGIIQSQLPYNAVPFIENQQIVAIASADPDGNLWSSLFIGEPGMISAINDKEISISLPKVHSNKSDIAFQNLGKSSPIGVLFFEPSTRRRYRVNGNAKIRDKQILIHIEEAYPNCPKYIQQRQTEEQNTSTAPKTVSGTELTDDLKAIIQTADTMFIASQGVDGKMDSSHRGGTKGFIKILEDGTLQIPDYPGNSMFNTLGNIYENPDVGILIPDWRTNSALQINGKGEIRFEQNSAEELKDSGNTGRFWVFTPEKWLYTKNHNNRIWHFIENSPFNPT